jgi:hypothetical protein
MSRKEGKQGIVGCIYRWKKSPQTIYLRDVACNDGHNVRCCCRKHTKLDGPVERHEVCGKPQCPLPKNFIFEYFVNLRLQSFRRYYGQPGLRRAPHRCCTAVNSQSSEVCGKQNYCESGMAR